MSTCYGHLDVARTVETIGLTMILTCNMRNIQWIRSIFAKPNTDLFPVCAFIDKILFHTSILPDSLVCRFINFFEKCPKYSKFIVNYENANRWNTCTDSSSTWKNHSRSLIENILKNKKGHELTFSELQQFIINLNKENFKSPRDFNKLIKTLDDICFEKIGYAVGSEDAIRLNYSWLRILGTQIINLKLFKQSLKNFKIDLSVDGNVSTPLIISVLFYSGLARKDHMTKEIVALSLYHLCNTIRNDLSTTEKVIIADVSFKTGCKIKYPLFIEHLVNVTNQDIGNFVNDPVILIAIIKMMRHNKYNDFALLKNIEKSLFEDKSILLCYNFTVQTHLIALYADALYGRHEFLHYIFDTAIRSMVNIGSHRPFNEGGRNEITNSVRAKDIARLVWASSYLGFKFNDETMEKTILPMITRKVSKGVYKKKIDMLIDTVLSLWIMGYKTLELIPTVFSKETIKHVSDNKRIRHKSRLLLLSTCISIESPEVMKNSSMDIFPSVDYYNTEEENMLKQRPALKNVLQDMKDMIWDLGAVEIKCEYSVPSLNIPGISVRTYHKNCRSVFYIEVLDSTNCLHNTDTPFGLMILKLRLLRKLGHKIILVIYSAHKNNKSNLIHEVEEEIMKIKQS